MATIALRVSGEHAKRPREIAITDLEDAIAAAHGGDAAAAESPEEADLCWVDILSPGEAEKAWLTAQHYHEKAIEDCFEEPAPKAFVYDRHRFVVVRARSADSDVDTQFLCAFLTDRLLVTVRHSQMPAVDAFAERFGRRKVQARTSLGAEYLLYELLDAIAEDWQPILRVASERVDDLEDRVFDPDRKYPNLLQELHEMKQDLREISKSVNSLREVVGRMLRSDTEFTSADCGVYWQDIQDAIAKMAGDVESYNAGAASTRDTYLSQSTMRLAQTQAEANDVIRTLTILATLLFPVTAIASIFGMNIEVFGASTEMFGLESILLMMGLTSGGIFALLLWKGWLGGARD